jgi:hypothetical protein
LRIAVAIRAFGFAFAGSLLLLAVLASGRVAAQPASRAPQAGDRYFIEFRSRPSSYIGHTYIVYGRTDATGRVLDVRVAGLIPDVDDAMEGFLVAVPGSVQKYQDDVSEKPNAVYGRRLTAAEYAAVERAVRIMKKTQRKWHLIFQNCNDFGIGIAEALGMRRPPSLMPPYVWISTLRLLNER